MGSKPQFHNSIVKRKILYEELWRNFWGIEKDKKEIFLGIDIDGSVIPTKHINSYPFMEGLLIYVNLD